MKISEAIEELKKYPGDYNLRIHCFGGIGGHPIIQKITLGFDWDTNSVLLHSVPLKIYNHKGRHIPKSRRERKNADTSRLSEESKGDKDLSREV